MASIMAAAASAPLTYLCSWASFWMGVTENPDSSICTEIYEHAKHEATEFVLDAQWAVTSTIDDNTQFLRQGLLGVILTVFQPLVTIIFIVSALTAFRFALNSICTRIVASVTGWCESARPFLQDYVWNVLKRVISFLKDLFTMLNEHLRWLGMAAGLAVILFWLCIHPAAVLLTMWNVWWLPYIIPLPVRWWLTPWCLGAICTTIAYYRGMKVHALKSGVRYPPEYYTHVIMHADPPELKKGLYKVFASLSPCVYSSLFGSSSASSMRWPGNRDHHGNRVVGAFEDGHEDDASEDNVLDSSPGRTYGLPPDFYDQEDSFDTTVTSILDTPVRKTVNTTVNTPVRKPAVAAASNTTHNTTNNATPESSRRCRNCKCPRPNIEGLCLRRANHDVTDIENLGYMEIKVAHLQDHIATLERKIAAAKASEDKAIQERKDADAKAAYCESKMIQEQNASHRLALLQQEFDREKENHKKVKEEHKKELEDSDRLHVKQMAGRTECHEEEIKKIEQVRDQYLAERDEARQEADLFMSLAGEDVAKVMSDLDKKRQQAEKKRQQAEKRVEAMRVKYKEGLDKYKAEYETRLAAEVSEMEKRKSCLAKQYEESVEAADQRHQSLVSEAEDGFQELWDGYKKKIGEMEAAHMLVLDQNEVFRAKVAKLEASLRKRVDYGDWLKVKDLVDLWSKERDKAVWAHHCRANAEERTRRTRDSLDKAEKRAINEVQLAASAAARASEADEKAKEMTNQLQAADGKVARLEKENEGLKKQVAD